MTKMRTGIVESKRKTAPEEAVVFHVEATDRAARWSLALSLHSKMDPGSSPQSSVRSLLVLPMSVCFFSGDLRGKSG